MFVMHIHGVMAVLICAIWGTDAMLEFMGPWRKDLEDKINRKED